MALTRTHTETVVKEWANLRELVREENPGVVLDGETVAIADIAAIARYAFNE